MKYKMKVWLIIFLVLMVSHRIQSQLRLVVNTTCLELAKPSNQQLRLNCRQYDYHCLLDETFTKEFEVCREWKWIPGGKCAYFNSYGRGNIDQTNCIQKTNLTCSNGTDEFSSVNSTKYTACYVKKETSTPPPVTTIVESQTRLVVNTTCLELAKPSNQQYRLTCRQHDYHCLLDENFTKEFEVCRDWKWIPGGKCAFFNTYGRGDIDERNCIPKNNLTCSHGTVQFSSATNTKYTACYVKKYMSTSLPVTTSGTQSYGGNATSFSTSSDKQYEISGHALPIILGIIVPLVSLAVIYFIFMHLKYIPLYRKAYHVESQELSDIARNEDFVEQQPFLRNEPGDPSESPPTLRHEDENITEARRNVFPMTDKGIVEKQPILRIKVEGTSTSESAPTMRHEDGNIAEARRSDMDESDLSQHFEDATASPTIIKQKNSEVSTDKDQKGDNDELRTDEVDSDTCKSTRVDISEILREGRSISDGQRKKLDEEKPAENASGLCIVSDKSDNEEGDTQDVFDDTEESLQRIAHPTDEQDRELCTELFNLLHTEGLNLTQKVMTATITRETGKSVKILLNSLTDQEKDKLKEMLPEESRRIIESNTEHDTSLHVSYGLHRIILDEEKSPKSGWGNPVRGTDIGIGDDVERLNRIHTIGQGILNPLNVSVESYVRLLNIMIEALIRLDPGAKFKEDYKLLSYKLKSIKNPNLTQTMFKTITDIVNKIWYF